MKQVVFEVADSGHFGFLPLQLSPTLLRGTPILIFFFNLQGRQKRPRNEPSLSTVTEVLQMTQLDYT